MIKAAAVAAAVIAAAAAAAGASAVPHLSAEEHARFAEFETSFGRVYADESERAQRASLFAQRLRAARAHNARAAVAGGPSWLQAERGPLMDHTEAELKSMRGARRPGKDFKSAHEIPYKPQKIDLASLPGHVDWREQGVVSGIKNQGLCGSCWTFATAETIESQYAIKSKGKLLYTLSEQQVASCVNPHTCGGTGGCEGGIVEAAFDQLVDMGGIATEWTYPYVSFWGNDEKCKFNASRTRPAVKVTGYTKLPMNEYEPLMNAIATVGPIAITVDASTWSTYAGGVFDGCNQTSPSLDHAVVVVGYGTDPVHGDYWLVRNSWGPEWGESGYIRLKRTSNWRCGWDTNPMQGDECKNGPIERVCGTCGIWVDSAYPHIAVNE